MALHGTLIINYLINLKTQSNLLLLYSYLLFSILVSALSQRVDYHFHPSLLFLNAKSLTFPEVHQK